MNRYVLTIVMFFSLSSCSLNNSCSDMKFERLLQADHIVITDNMNKEIGRITKKVIITEIANFALSHGTEWITPWYGTPIAKLRANFYVGKKFIGDLGVGGNFIAAQGCHYFQVRDISLEDRKVIINLFDAEDPYKAN